MLRYTWVDKIFHYHKVKMLSYVRGRCTVGKVALDMNKRL